MGGVTPVILTPGDTALALFEADLALFPLLPNEKIPPKCWHWSANAPDCAECGHRRGTAMLMNTRVVVVSYWRDNPSANIGINCAESALLAVDQDSLAAADRFARLWYQHEGTELIDSGTPIMQTRPARFQTWFDMPTPPVGCPRRHRLGADIDIKGAGGMVVGPGSVISGYRRHLIAGDVGKLLPAPGWLIPLCGSAAPQRPFNPGKPVKPWSQDQAEWELHRAYRALKKVEEHGSREGRKDLGRNRAVYNEAFRLRRALPALGYEEIEAKLLEAAEQNGLLADDGEYKTKTSIRSGLGG